MELAIYSAKALRTEKPLEGAARVWHATCGMVGEVGELFDAFKRHRVYGKPLDAINVMEEVADFWWYFNIWMEANGYPAFNGHTHATLGVDLPAMDEWDTDRCLGDLLFVSNVLFTAGTKKSEVFEVLGYIGSDEQQVSQLLRDVYATSAKLCQLAGGDFATALGRNIDKLQLRFPDAYTDSHALNRDTSVERKALEGTRDGDKH